MDGLEGFVTGADENAEVQFGPGWTLVHRVLADAALPEQTVISPATRARRCRKACFAIGRCAAGLF